MTLSGAEKIVFDLDNYSFSEPLCPIVKFIFKETTTKNNDTLKIDENCPSTPDSSIACRTVNVPTTVVRDGYLEDYPVLTYQLTLIDKGGSSALFQGQINITCSDVIQIT
jgi:hypothetical protein